MLSRAPSTRLLRAVLAAALAVAVAAAGVARALSVVVQDHPTCMSYRIDDASRAAALRVSHKSNVTQKDGWIQPADLIVTLKPPPHSGGVDITYKLRGAEQSGTVGLRLVPFPHPTYPGLYLYGEYEYCFERQHKGLIARAFAPSDWPEEVTVTFEVLPMDRRDATVADEKARSDPGRMVLLRPDEDGYLEAEGDTGRRGTGAAAAHRLAKHRTTLASSDAARALSEPGDVDGAATGAAGAPTPDLPRKEAPIEHRHIDALTQQLHVASQLVRDARADADAMVSAEKAFRSTSESTFTRVWVFGLLTIAASVGQVFIASRGIRRALKEKKLA